MIVLFKVLIVLLSKSRMESEIIYLFFFKHFRICSGESGQGNYALGDSWVKCVLS